MTDQKRVHESKVLPPAVDRVSSADALGAFNEIVRFLREAIQIQETESTKREQLKTYRETEVARIKASEKALRYYLDRTYEERHETHKRLFESLDVAVAAGDGRIKPGELVMLEAMGGGFTWGAVLLRW
mgnify:CR=1 FL=1